MGTVYAIANQKGGVGKTTTAVNVAACIAEAGYETLLVDVDPQGNATVGLGVSRDEGPGLYEVLAGDVAAADAVRATDIERLSMLVSTPDLAGATMELPAAPGLGGRGCATRWRRSAAHYAFTLLDCPPSLGPADRQRAGRRRPRDRAGADRVLRARGARRPAGHARADPARAQPAADGRRDAADDARRAHEARAGRRAEVRAHFPALVFDTVIPRNVRLGEAPSYGRPVIHHDPHCAGAEAYFELAKEVAARG